MKKVLPILVIGILVLSGLGAVATNSNSNTENNVITTKSETSALSFSLASINEYDSQYFEVELEDVSTYVMNPGNPVLPKVIKTFELPFDASDIEIEVFVNNVQEQDIEGEIRPASPHIPLIATEEEIVITPTKNEDVYSSEELFPSEWYDYKISSGLNENNERAKHVALEIYPVRYSPKLDKIVTAESAEITVTYETSGTTVFSTDIEDEYDLVIIAPRKFSLPLNKLVDHKNTVGVKTFMKTTEEIYKEYEGVDKPEEIKLFIKDAIETHDIKYVLLVGGLKNQIWANPREHANYGAKDWYVPVRYHNFIDDPEHPLTIAKIYDPGVITDLYYADIYNGTGDFDDWDSNDDGIIGAWNYLDEAVEDDTIDMYPDVSLGRLACRSISEVRTVVNKIINYEKNSYGEEWFKKMVVVSGDGFLDQEDLDFQWDTNCLPDGEYTIYGQSRSPTGPYGPVDKIVVTLDIEQETSLTFNHDDHLRVSEYPSPAIAEISSVSDGDILGNTDYVEEISEGQAYGNSVTGWGNVNFTAGILHIRGKTYDPSPYGNVTNIHVWVLNEEGEIVFDDWRNGSEMYYEGEWVVGEKLLKGGGGALYYMPEDFEKESLFASNGGYTGPKDIISSMSEGAGFVFMSGHGSPNVWTDHTPGIPGNRGHASIPSLAVTTIKIYPPFIGFPLFPMSKINNKEKLPIVVVGGCHNSQFNVTIIPGLLDIYNKRNTWCHGSGVPECFSWYMVQMPRGGAIASIGNTGLGYGVLGKDCNIEGLDGGICIEFFKQYGMEYDANEGAAYLGDVYTKTLQSYHDTFDMDFLDHAKSLTQWVLLGDPSLMIGGYSS